MAACDIRAIEVLDACGRAGVSVPDAVAVLGVDNDVLLGTFARPPLSSIDTDPFSLGRRAGEMLAERMADAKAAPRVVLHPPRRVVERASTEVYPFRTPWLSDAMVFIARNVSRGITAKDVFARLGYSHTAVNNAFRAELGTSVHREILRRRLALACRLLKETDRPAAKVATDSGFLNAQYFSRAFSSAFGTTPDAWRRPRPLPISSSRRTTKPLRNPPGKPIRTRKNELHGGRDHQARTAQRRIRSGFRRAHRVPDRDHGRVRRVPPGGHAQFRRRLHQHRSPQEGR
jgi:AraC-like DNA-binding protein